MSDINNRPKAGEEYEWILKSFNELMFLEMPIPNTWLINPYPLRPNA